MNRFYPEFLEKLSIVAVTDKAGTIVYVNDKFCEISQYSREELIGQNHRIVNSGQHEKSFFVDMWKTISNGKDWRGDICNKAKDGSLYWVDTFISPQLDENNKPVRYYSFRILINDKKKQEQVNKEIYLELHNKNVYLNSLLNIQGNFFILRLNMLGNYTYVNEAFLKRFGYTSEDIIGKNYAFSIYEEDIPVCEAGAVEALQKPGVPANVTMRKYASNKDIYLTEWQFVTINDTSGNPIEMQAIGFDITEKSKYLEEINFQKQQMESILSSIDEVIWSCRADDFKILFMNKTSIKLFGYTPEEFYEDEYLLFNIIQKEDQLLFTEHLQRLRLNGNSVFEYRIKHKNGSIKHVYDRVTKVQNRDGTYILNGVAADLTSLRQFEEKTKNYEKKLIRTFETISGAFFLLNKEWQFEYLNESAEKLLLRTKGELMHKTIWETFPEAVHTKFFSKYTDAVLFNKNFHFEEFYAPLNAWFSMSVFPNSEGLAVYFQDITSKKLAEDVLKMQNRKLKEIAWLQSHKVRGPVANILGLINIIDKANMANPINLQALNLLEKAAFKLDEIIHEDYLNFGIILFTFGAYSKEIKISCEPLL